MKRIVFFPLLAALLVGCNNNRLTPDPGSEEKQAELSEKALVSILTESHYAPNEFAEALGAPSMTALLEEMVPGVLPWAQALMKAKVKGAGKVLSQSLPVGSSYSKGQTVTLTMGL